MRQFALIFSCSIAIFGSVVVAEDKIDPALGVDGPPPNSEVESPASPNPAPNPNPNLHPKPELPPITQPGANLGVPAVNNLNGAIQNAAANPMNPAARTNLSQAGANAMLANRLIDKAAASGKYDTSDYGKVKAALAAAVMRQQPQPGNAQKNAANKADPQADRAALNDQPSRKTASGTVSQSVANTAPSAGGQVQLFAPVNDVRIALHFDNPSVAPKQAAEFVAQKVKSDLAALALGKLAGGPDEEPKSFVTALLTSIVREGERVEGARDPNSAADSTHSEKNDSNKDATTEDRVTIGGNSTVAGAIVGTDPTTDSDLEQPLTPEEKEFLAGLIKGAIEKAKDKVPDAEALAEASEAGRADAEFLAAVKNAGRDSIVFDALSDDIASSIQKYVENDPKSRRAVRNILLERAKKQWADASSAPVERAPASELPAVTEWQGGFAEKDILLVLAALLAAAVGIGEAVAAGKRRRKGQAPPAS